MFKTKTPQNIESLSLSEVVKLIPANLDTDLPKPINRMSVIKIIFKILGYDLSPDLAYALCSEPTAQLILATAGGGKTTAAQIKAILQKIYRKSKRNPNKKISGDKILCLVYNKHNVEPMKLTHKKLINRLRTSNISDLHIDDEIYAATMHSFCDQIRKEHVAKLQYVGFHLQKDNEALAVMRTVKTKILAKHKLRCNPKEEDLLLLYNYAKESMLAVSELEETDKFQDIKLGVEVLEDIFMYYDKLKRAKKRYDYVDMLTKVYDLLKNDNEVLKSTQRYFEYVIADEVQDFTPIMMSILQLLVSNGTPLMCIGDEDQSIYSFRGADIYNTLDFSSKYDGGEVFSLIRNRRCRAAILNIAKGVIEENKIRYDKQIVGLKDGGNVEFIPFTSVEGEHLKLISMIKQLNFDEMDNSVICYRDRNSSIMLTEMLAEEDIPFHVISGYGAYSHILYKDMIEVLNALESPFDKNLSISLYKVLPVKKEKMFSVLGYDPTIRRFKDDNKQHFISYDYGEAMQIKGFAECMNKLSEFSVKIQSEPLDSFFPELFAMLKKYHWNFLRSTRDNFSIYDDYVEMRIDKTFNQHKTYKAVFDELSSKMEICRRNDKIHNGIAISTFHGLKGLEYDRCYLIDLDNEKFPNFSFIEARPYSENVKTYLKEGETRLFYVALTRAKDNLFLFYNEDNPSRYLIPYVKSNKFNITTEIAAEDIAENEIVENNVKEDIVAEGSAGDLDLLDLFSDDVNAEESKFQVKNDPEDSDDLLDLFIETDELPKSASETKANPVKEIQHLDIDNLVTSSRSSYINNLIANIGGKGNGK